MWQVINEKILYEFMWNRDGYELKMTDFKSVYVEKLTVDQIERRADQLGNPFSLGSATGLHAFCKIINEKLSINEVEMNSIGEVKLSSSEDGFSWTWIFYLTPLPRDEANLICQTIILNLYGVIEKAVNLINDKNTIISQKDLVIRGLDEAGMRGVQYKPPPYLVKSFQPNETNNINIRELLKIGWGHKCTLFNKFNVSSEQITPQNITVAKHEASVDANSEPNIDETFAPQYETHYDSEETQ